MQFTEEQVMKLYIDDCLSVMHISKSLSLSCSQIENVLNRNKIPRRSISEAITVHNITKYGLKQFIVRNDLSHEDELLKVAGAMLYSGEGSKRGGSVALSNSNPEIIKVFMHFLRHVCGVAEDRIHATIHLYEDHNPDELLTFWSQIVQIPETQFYKPYLHARKGGTYRDRSLYGTISIQYSDKKLHTLILMWIDEYYKTIPNEITSSS
jgi:hypothetical protein